MTETLPPVWLLDVDGVVNADHPRGWSCAPYRRRVHAETEYRLRWSPPLMRRIRALVYANAVELRWCTTWCPYAHLLEDAWNLPALPRALTDGECELLSPGRIDAAKVDAARKVLADGRRLIWTDDTAVPAFGPAHDELTRGGRALLIRPVSKVGLQPEHMDLIEAFAAAG